MAGELRSNAAREMGQARTPKKQAASRETLNLAREERWTDERRAAHAAKMQEIWARKKAEKGAG